MVVGTNGLCLHCGRALDRAAMRAHLEALPPHAGEGAILLQVLEAGGRWLFLVIRSYLHLEELDAFLRFCWPDLGRRPGAFHAGLRCYADDGPAARTRTGSLGAELSLVLAPGESCTFATGTRAAPAIRIGRLRCTPSLPPGARGMLLARSAGPALPGEGMPWRGLPEDREQEPRVAPPREPAAVPAQAEAKVPEPPRRRPPPAAPPPRSVERPPPAHPSPATPTQLATLTSLFPVRGLAALRHPDIAVIAFAVTGQRVLTVEEIGQAVARVGLRVAPGFWDLPTAAFARAGTVGATGGHLALIARSTEADLERLISEVRATPPPTRAAPPRPRPGPGRSARPPAPAPKKRKTGAARKPAGKTRSTAASAEAPPPIAVPPPPPLEVAPPRWEPIDPIPLAALLSGAPLPDGDFTHALEAHALAAAESFEELLSPPVLRGVDAQAYQLETVRRVLRQFRGRALLADEVGLGKTVEAIMVLREYQLRGMVRRALILVPPALVGQWEEELRSKAALDPRVAGDLDDSGDFWRQDGVILASQGLARLARHATVIQEQAWDLVIVDEAHRFKNRATLAWKLIDGLRSRFLLALTATPVETDLEELYNLVTLLRPGQLATLAEFRRRHVDRKDPTAPRDPALLRERLAEIMVRNTRATCGLALPPRYVTTVTVPPAPGEQALYAAVLDLFRRFRKGQATRLADTLLIEAGSSPTAVAATLRRAIAGDQPPELAEGLRQLERSAAAVTASAKTTALVDLLRAHREKALVFTRFRETLDHLEATARAAGIPTAVVHGGLGRAAKQEAFRRFREEALLLLATDVGSEGQNLQFCRLLVNYDLPWNPMLIEQRIGRLHRYGQTEPVHVYNLCAQGTVEERVLDVLDRRVHLFELVVGEMDLVVGNLVEQQDLEARILSLYAQSDSEEAIAAGFDAIAEELARARGQYDKVRALDEALFGEDFET
ncbi:MAG: SNF2-related protein [Pseudomonadota bacterium]